MVVRTRVSKSEVYSVIESDLLNAIAVLPAKKSMDGRATSFTAHALLGKVYLYQDKFAEAANIFNFELHVACPKEFQPKNKDFINVTFTESLDQAIDGSSLVTTDVWVSMGDEKEKELREKMFQDYQISPVVMDKAKDNAIFLHCLPAIRGQEISADLFEDERSKVWIQAENRLHTQKALLIELLS